MLEKIQFYKDESRILFNFFKSENIEKIYLKKVIKKTLIDNEDFNYLYSEKLLYLDEKKVSINVLKYLDHIEEFNRDTDFYICYFEKKKSYNFENESFKLESSLKRLLSNFSLNRLEVFIYKNLSFKERKKIQENVLNLEDKSDNKKLKTIFAFLNNELEEVVKQKINEKYKEKNKNEEYYLNFKIELEKKKREFENMNFTEKLQELKSCINKALKNESFFEKIEKDKTFYLVDDMTKFIYYYFIFLSRLKRKRNEIQIELERNSSNTSKYLSCGEFLTKNKVEKYLEKLYSKSDNNEKKSMEDLFRKVEKIKKQIQNKADCLDVFSEKIKFMYNLGFDRDKYYFFTTFIDGVEIGTDFLKVKIDEIKLINNQLYFIKLKNNKNFIGGYNKALSNEKEKKYVFINDVINERIISFDIKEIDFIERVISLKIKKEEKEQSEEEKENLRDLESRFRC